MRDPGMDNSDPDLMRSQGEEAGSHSCPHCDRKFKRMVNFKTHLKTHEPKKFTCMWCNREFLQERTLLGHICSPVRKWFRCQICGENFYNRKKLQMHGESCLLKPGEDESDKEVVEPASKGNILLDEKANHISLNDKSEHVSKLASLDEKSEHVSQVPSLDKKSKHVSQVASLDKKSEHVSQVASLDEKSEHVSQIASLDEKSEHASQVASLDKKSEHASQVASLDKKSEHVSQVASLDEKSEHVSQDASLDEKSKHVSKLALLDENSDHVSQVDLHEHEEKDSSDESSIRQNKPKESHKHGKDDCLIAIKRVDSRAVVVPNVVRKSLLLTENFSQQKQPDLPIGCSLAEFCGKRSIIGDETGSSPKFAKIMHKAEKSPGMQTLSSMQTNKKDILLGTNRICVIRKQNGKEISRENLDDSELVSLRRERKGNGEDCVQVYRKPYNSERALIAQEHIFHQGNKPGGNDYMDKAKADNSKLKKYVTDQLTRSNVHLPEKKIYISKVGKLQTNRKMNVGRVDGIKETGIKNVAAHEKIKNLSPVFFRNVKLPSLQSKSDLMNYDNASTFFKCIPCNKSFKSLTSFQNHRIYHVSKVQQSCGTDKNIADVSMQQQADDVKITVLDTGKAMPPSLKKTQPTKLKIHVVTQAGKKSIACSKCGQKVQLQHELQDYVGSPQEHSDAGEMVYISRFSRPVVSSGKEKFQCSCNQNLVTVVSENNSDNKGNDCTTDNLVDVKKEMTDDDVLFREELERPDVSTRKSESQGSSFGNFDKKKRVLESSVSSASGVSGIFEARVKKEPSEDGFSFNEEEIQVKKELSDDEILLRKEMESYELAGFHISDLRVKNPEAFANIKYELNEEEDVDIVIKEEQDDTDSG